MAAHPVDVYVGKRLRLRRGMLGISQDALGKMIGVTFQQIQKYERGANRVGASRLFRFAESLKVPVGYFFEGMESTRKQAAGLAEDSAGFEVEPAQSKEAMSVVRAYYNIQDQHVRKKMLALMKTLAISGELDDKAA